jgi:hypothetical protein
VTRDEIVAAALIGVLVITAMVAAAGFLKIF